MLKFKDVVLRDFNLDILREPCYLDDQIIEFYFTYLSSSIDTITDVLLVEPSQSRLIANDKECVEEYVQSWKISSKRVVLFPVNDGEDGGNHWSILVYDRTKNLFMHFDSMEGVNNFHAEKLYNAVKEHMGPGGEVSRSQASSSETPQQSNGYDCGLYVLAIAREICQWCSRGHNKSDMISTIQKNVC